jgi:atypical dual specificity phosphatase
MWTWSLNWGEITPQIVIGSCPMKPADLRRIRDGADVSAVFSLQHDDCHAYWSIDYGQMCSAGAALALEMDRRPIRDFDIPDMRRHLPTAVSGLARLLSQGHRTYVHCTAGLGRAPLTVLGYLTLVEGRDPEDAIQLILNGRPGAVPAWEAYHGCCEDLVAFHRESIEHLAYDLYESGANGDADANWRQAQAEVLRSALVGQG